MCWLSCAPISTIPPTFEGQGSPNRNSNISAPEIATWRVSATTRVTPTENIWDQKMVQPSTLGASSTASSIHRVGCANSVKRWRTHRFRNWSGSRDSARMCTTAGLRELGGAILDRQAGSQLGRLRSLDLEVLRGCLPAVLDEFVLNGLTLVQSAKSGAFNGRDVYEHILPAFLGLDEAIALRRIEPLYGALRHARSPKYYQRHSLPQSSSCEQGRQHATFGIFFAI